MTCRRLSKTWSDRNVFINVLFGGTVDLYHGGRSNLLSKQRTGPIISIVEGRLFLIRRNDLRGIF